MLQEEVGDMITKLTIQDAETSDADASLPLTSAPSKPAEKPSRDSTTVYFELETASRVTDCEILQIAMVSEHSTFSKYLTPLNDIAPSAMAVNGLHIAYNKDRKCLSKNGVLLESSPKEEAFQAFLSHLDTMQPFSTPPYVIFYCARRN